MVHALSRFCAKWTETIVFDFGHPESINYKNSDKSLVLQLFVIYLHNIEIKKPHCLSQ